MDAVGTVWNDKRIKKGMGSAAGDAPECLYFNKTIFHTAMVDKNEVSYVTAVMYEAFLWRHTRGA